MSIKLPLIASSLLIAMSGVALAHDLDAIVKEREARQAQRIEQGRRTGEITWTEGLKLRSEQRKIDAAERAFLADDGKIDRQEYRQLKAMQDQARESIRAEAHDGHRRPWWLPRFGW